MQLYLSSYKIGARTEVLKEWISKNNNKICVIFNALDGYPDNERKIDGIAKNASQLTEIGFEYTLLDLRKYFGKSEELNMFLKDYKAFYVLGGNTFILRRAMKLSGFDEYLRSITNNPNYLYAGYSAGICILSKDLHAIAVMDEAELDPYNYGSVIYEGIGLLDYTIIPHYESDHPETELASEAKKYCELNSINYKTLKDGEVILENISTYDESQNFTIS